MNPRRPGVWLASMGFAFTTAVQAASIGNPAGPGAAALDASVCLTGPGCARVEFGGEAHSHWVAADFADRTGATTLASTQCCTAPPADGASGVAAPAPFSTAVATGVAASGHDLIFDTLADPTLDASFLAAGFGAAAAGRSAEGRTQPDIDASAGADQPQGSVRAIPEPAMLALLALGVVGLASRHRHPGKRG